MATTKQIAFKKTLIATACFSSLIFTSLGASAQTDEEPESVQDVIIVTGERFARPLSETASSVFVIDQSQIDRRAGGDNVDDFLELVPNFQVSGNQNNGPTIRGQNSTGVLSGINAFFGGSRQRATILLDGRPLSFNEFIFGQTGVWDVDAVEVFLGPQTTAQGPDSIAGAIYVNTNDPTYEYEGAVRAVDGNFDTYQVSGMANIPLVDDQFALRAVIDYRDHESFVDFTFPEEAIGADRTQDSYLTGRVKLLFEPDATPGLKSILTYSFTDVEGPQSENVQPPFEDRTRSVPGVSVFATETHALVSDISYAFGNGFTLSNRLTYADAEVDRFAPAGQGVSSITRDEFTNETLLTYDPGDGPFEGLAGVYVQSFDADETIDLAAFRIGTGTFEDEFSAVGVFGEGTYSVTERLHLTGGIRYQEAAQDRQGGFAALPPVIFDKTFSEWLPKAGIAYDVSDDIRIGFEARKGFNPGGVTLSFATFQLDTFEEETLWNYELYARSNLLDGRLQLNGNVFYTDFTDAQRPVNVVALGGVIVELAQAEAARSYGVEVQGRFQVNDRLAVTGALGLLETELETVSLEPTLEGNEFERSPGVSASIGVDFEPIDNLNFNVQGRYTDSYFSDDANTALTEVDSFFAADARAAYSFGQVTVFAYANNIFDEFNTLQQFGAGTGVVTDPREYGAGIEFRF